MAVATILPHVTPAAVRLEFPHDEITDLALDLMHDEPCMQLPEARRHALALLDELAIYAAAWDHLAGSAANADTLPFRR
ncbi:MAG TPA: hypothetical protein VGD69_21795 [Herpetosiphonaceae bacterium]